MTPIASPAPRTARTPPRLAPPQRIAAADGSPPTARPALRAAAGYVAGYWAMDGEIAAARLAAAPAARVRLLPAVLHDDGTPALRALAPGRRRWSATAIGIPEPDARTGLAARARDDGAGGAAAGGLRRARPPARHGRRLVRPQLRVPPRPAPRRRGWSAPASRSSNSTRCARRLGRARWTRSAPKRTTHRLAERSPHDRTPPLLADEVRTRRVLASTTCKRVGTEPWTGVRNYQARNFMRDGMQVGDGVLFYHSNTAVPGIAGIATVASSAYPDPTQFEPKSRLLRPEEHARGTALVAGRRRASSASSSARSRWRRSSQHADELGEDFALIQRGSRLSVLPVTAAQWKLRRCPSPGHDDDPERLTP